MDKQKKEIANRLTEAASRIGGGSELSRRSGIPRGTMQRYLSGETEPKITDFVKMANITDISVQWLATGEGRQSPEPEPTNSGYQITFDIVAECSKALHEWLKKDKSTLEPEDIAYITALLCEVYEEQGKIDTKFIDRLMKLKGNMR